MMMNYCNAPDRHKLTLKVTRRHWTILESSGTFCTQCINLQGVENAKKITVSIISANSSLKITKNMS